MNEENIIYVNFASGTVSTPPPPDAHENELARPMEGRNALAADVVVKKDLIERTITSLRIAFSHETLASRQQIVNTMSSLEVAEAVSRSCEKDWREKPAYYWTLAGRIYDPQFFIDLLRS